MGLYDYCNAAWPTSVEELDNQIVIHPNPTLGVLRIETNLAYTFSVYHPLGFVVVDRSTDRVVDLSKWPSGAYHMILSNEIYPFSFFVIAFCVLQRPVFKEGF